MRKAITIAMAARFSPAAAPLLPAAMAGVDPAEVEQPAAPPPGPRAAAVTAEVPATPAAAPVAERPTAAPAHGRRHRALNATLAFRAAAVPAAALASGATRAAARQYAGAAPAPPVQAASAAAARTRARPDLVRSLLLRRELLLAPPAGVPKLIQRCSTVDSPGTRPHDGTGAMSSTTTRRVPGSIW